MGLNHLNLAVTDVPTTREFFETYFGFTSSERVRSDKLAVMFGDDGMVFTLMKSDRASYPDTFHIGFVQESEERVDEINRRLKDDGYEVGEPRKFHGSWTFYFQAPGGITVEVLS